MPESKKYCVILTTCGNREEAEKLARLLIESRLAACVQLTGVTSFYEWDGAVNRDDEKLLLIKAKSTHYDRIEEFISKNHSYDVPEIIQLPISGGSETYLKWIAAVSK
ncbi:MAG: divalent-cation tolerance protein CutA [Deltaproteobacteria bacterium]|nr:divalent-cation tolerance protein CutA [Deltaproteobacteria bacterium]MBW2594532.1 divalent-cation tolerance protein CutA [Deltaproteobacteria bacterium]MBW2650475.1 divalent-cation tolerance protein CutA [Deltaproteobacteria bacterium]